MKDGGFATRRRLLRAVQEYPGLHLRELARQCDTSEALAAHHLDALLAEGLVRSESDENFRRFFATGANAPEPEDEPRLAILRQRVPLQVVMYLLEHGRATNQELAEAFRLAKSTASYHMARLVEHGILLRSQEGVLTLADPVGMERLLLRWRAPSTLMGRFVELWDDFYRRRPPAKR